MVDSPHWRMHEPDHAAGGHRGGGVSGWWEIGGGTLFCAGLWLAVGTESAQVQGTSLGAPLGRWASCVLGVRPQGNADIRSRRRWVSDFSSGGYSGAVGAQHISESWLRWIFAITLIAVGGRMWFSGSGGVQQVVAIKRGVRSRQSSRLFVAEKPERAARQFRRRLHRVI